MAFESLLLDLVALIVCFVWAHLTRDAAGQAAQGADSLVLEQAAFAFLLALTLLYWMLDLLPVLMWPLLRWALPPAYSGAVSRALSGALGRARAKVGGVPPGEAPPVHASAHHGAHAAARRQPSGRSHCMQALTTAPMPRLAGSQAAARFGPQAGEAAGDPPGSRDRVEAPLGAGGSQGLGRAPSR